MGAPRHERRSSCSRLQAVRAWLQGDEDTLVLAPPVLEEFQHILTDYGHARGRMLK